jgi:pSer/pThr/pTyr-binding forkhead associated (FHA) protein
MKISIKPSSGPTQEKTVNKSKVIIGRSKTCDIVIADEGLSRQHCQIEIEGGEFFITDLGSANGVFLDSKRIEPNVRTPFSTFWQIGLATLECQVLDNSDAPMSSTDYASSTGSDQTSFTTTTQRINRNAYTSSEIAPDSAKLTPNSKSKTERNNYGLGFKLSLLLLILVAGAFIYELQKPDEEKFTKKVLTVKDNIPESMAKIPDEFLSFIAYSEKARDASCLSDPEICKELHLSQVQSEGVFRQDQEFFIFMGPSLKAEQKEYEKIKDEKHRLAVMALNLILQSEFFKGFVKKDIAQIHLVLINEDKRPFQVYRFHQKYFARNGPEKDRLLTQLYLATESGETKKILDSMVVVKAKDL